jgi:hypothetical protein
VFFSLRSIYLRRFACATSRPLTPSSACIVLS